MMLDGIDTRSISRYPMDFFLRKKTPLSIPVTSEYIFAAPNPLQPCQISILRCAASTACGPPLTKAIWNISYIQHVCFHQSRHELHVGCRWPLHGGLLLGRTLSVLITMTFGTSLAARRGPFAMAAHQICLQVWLAVSLLSDALALSAQFEAAKRFEVFSCYQCAGCRSPLVAVLAALPDLNFALCRFYCMRASFDESNMQYFLYPTCLTFTNPDMNSISVAAGRSTLILATLPATKNSKSPSIVTKKYMKLLFDLQKKIDVIILDLWYLYQTYA